MSMLSRVVIWCYLTCAVIIVIDASPATTSAQTTHIVSYVKQQSLKANPPNIAEFDFETIKGSGINPKTNPVQQTSPTRQIFGRLVQQLDINLDNSLSMSNSNETKIITTKTDDLTSVKQNTLENSNDIFGNNEQHESIAKNGTSRGNGSGESWNRMKQSIPVLEPVKHLLNTVREGGFNHTAHANRQHHQLVSPNVGTNGEQNMTSSAIETEEEREMVNDSTSLKFLEVLGTIGSLIWSFVGNIRNIFAASISNASGASFSSSSGGS